MLGPDGTRPTHKYLPDGHHGGYEIKRLGSFGEIMRKNQKDAKSFPFWSQVFSFPSFEENHVVAILQLADLTFQVARAVAPGASCGCQMVSEQIAVKNVRDRQSIPESRVV
jgi:hypothetical protein